MILKFHPFLYDEGSINDSLNVGEYVLTVCKERVLFEVFHSAIITDEVFKDAADDDIPKEYVTRTGNLKRVLNRITDPLEYEVTLLNFENYHEMALSAWAIYRMENDNSENDDPIRQLLKMAVKAKIKQEKEKLESLGLNNKVESLESMYKRINITRNCNHSFAEYMEKMNLPLKNYTPEVDELLNKAMNENPE